MKYCRICGLNFPDDAQFCLKCGKSLDFADSNEYEVESPSFASSGNQDSAGTDESKKDLPRESASFTPSGDYGAGTSPQSGSRSSEPLPDYATCMREEVEQAAEISESWKDDREPPLEEQSDIAQNDVVANISIEKKPCSRCGAMNPHNQVFCVNCGAEIAAGSFPGEGKQNTQQFVMQPPTVQQPQPASTPSQSYQPQQPALEPPSLAAGDVYRTGAPPPVNQNSFLNRMTGWSAWVWVGLIAGVLLLSAGIWFLFYGGMDMLFSSEQKTMREADSAMSELSSYEYTINAAFESIERGNFTGNGKLLQESPDKTSWAVNIVVPDGRALQPRLTQIGEDQYVTEDTVWKPVVLEVPDISASSLWTGYSSIENLGDQNLFTYLCKHYKYRVPSDALCLAMGMTDSQGIGGADMEIWIDTQTKRIIRMEAKVYGMLIGGVKSDAVITMELSGTGLGYDIQPPVQ